jgi:hypothetical protein
MPELGIYILALAGIGLAFARSLRVAFGALACYWLLVPASLIIPGGPHILLVDRVVLYAFALRMVLRARKASRLADQGLAPRAGSPEATAGAFRFTAIHFAMIGVLVAGFLDGVVLAPHGVSLASDLDSWIYTFDMAVVFVAVLAVVRTLGARRVLGTITVVLMVTVVIGVFERLTKSGWSHFLFEHVPTSYLAPGAEPLGVRAGHVRAQAGAQFSLEYAWVLAMFLPLVAVMAFAWARPGRDGGSPRPGARLAYLLPLVAIGGIALTASRSAEVGVAGAAVLLVVATGAPRRITTAVGIGALVVLLVVLVDPALVGSPFSAAAHSNSISVRLQRLPNLFALVVHRPFTGLGYSGLYGSLPGVDDAYALLYATIGALGLAAWGLMLLTTGVTVARALRAPFDTDTRNLGAACLVGIAAVVVAGAAYDLVATPQSQWAFMILAALGVAVAETVPRRVRPHRWWTARALLPLAGVAAGLLVLATAPTSSSETVTVLMGSPAVIAAQSEPVDDYTGKVLVNTLCAFLTDPANVAAGTTVQCQRLSDVAPSVWPTLALVRITGVSPGAVRAEYRRALGRDGPYLSADVSPVGAVTTGKPAWATTAPMWAGLLGLAAMFLIPPLNRRPLSARSPLAAVHSPAGRPPGDRSTDDRSPDDPSLAGASAAEAASTGPTPAPRPVPAVRGSAPVG